MTYTYEQPSPNKSGYEPQPAPSAYFPTRGVKLNAETAIGGGPILLKDGSVRNTFIEELLRRKWSCSRKVIIIQEPLSEGNSNNKVIFFVCEGRSVTEGVKKV
ncbi:phosphodiester glycosidase family protein [Bacteroides ovatus]|nr:phosphodiester glycosidase family protein [Bacteroides ovatus]